MIWYLLYAFRGTTEPPRLNPDHPIRKAFYRHGRAAARHPVLSILISVGIAILLCYPSLFLYKNPVNSSSLPHHVWASAKPFAGGQNAPSDIELRQVWIHGSRMKALNQSVLQDAISIQQELLGPGFGQQLSVLENYAKGITTELAVLPEDQIQNMTWYFHSPLMYWNCSSAVVQSDEDILKTINDQASRRSFLNMTLRPTTVFAGKAFAKNQLLAADALVITLFNRFGFGVGRQWDERSSKLASTKEGSWSFYPGDGKVTRSQLFEFRFQPMSFKDDFLLATAYFFMALYVVVSLRKMKAFRSQFGLGVTAITQIATSILASFTLCAILDIKLAQIPREAYPFVVLVIGLENMFRLVNAVLSLPPELPTSHRIATALGEVGHRSLAAAAQNLLLLWLLSRLRSPGISEFCAFAAVAIVFDFVFHLTFFLGVLAVDIKRLELQDSLSRASGASFRSRSPKARRQTWSDALIQGQLPFSTRVAGSAVMMCFVLGLNYQYLEKERQAISLFRFLFSLMRSGNASSTTAGISSLNNTRTPLAWLKMQDQVTAKEVIRVVKPHAHSFVARVFEPLVIILENADRTDVSSGGPQWLSHVRQVAEDHFFPFGLAVVFVVAFVALLMNFLLWNEIRDNQSVVEESAPDPSLSVRTLARSQNLDIVQLVTRNDDCIAAVALDRSISIWWKPRKGETYLQTILSADALSALIWPLAAVTFDPTGQWLALCSQSGRVALWSVLDRRIGRLFKISPQGRKPLAVELNICTASDGGDGSLLVLTPEGRLEEMSLNTGQTNIYKLSDRPLVQAQSLRFASMGPGFLALDTGGEILLLKKSENGWFSEVVPLQANAFSMEKLPPLVQQVFLLGDINVMLVREDSEIEMIDFSGLNSIRKIQTGDVRCLSLHAFHSPRRKCIKCGSWSITSLSVLYTEPQSQKCIMHNFTASEPGQLLCLRSKSSSPGKGCEYLEDAIESLHWVDHCGSWSVTGGGQGVIGIRRQPAARSSTEDDHTWSSTTAPRSSWNMKQRRVADNGRMSPLEPEDGWEAWHLSSTGEFQSVPLLGYEQIGDSTNSQLLVSRPGPICSAGPDSVAVGFGNTVKIISVASSKRVQAEVSERWSSRETSPSAAQRMPHRKGL